MPTAQKTAESAGLLYLDNLGALREKLARAEHDGSMMGRVWSGVRRRAQAAPASFPWFVPFVAMATGARDDIESAKQAVRNYVATFEAQQFGMGLQFHFWCFAFPHGRWSLYFDWLDKIGAWDRDEAARLREALVAWQYVNFFYGMRTKPEPECVDNQTMSLCFSNAIVGHLFGSGDDASATAARMRRDGMRRLPSTLGGFPPSGYSGEGSTYMDLVVGPSIPFVVELLEHAEGGEWFSRKLEPNGGSAESIVRMIAREWTPAGLTLPWDHYGFHLPARSCIAYGAHKTGDPLYLELLENHACWGHDHQIGWGYDDLVWSLIWWPETSGKSKRVGAFRSWAERDVGAAIVSQDASLYLMQMWDESTPGFPGRAHVNPNNLILTAFGSPLTVDGVAAKTCKAFEYPDAWIERSGMDFNVRRDSFGSGCAGAHSVLIVDGWEGMRATKHYEQGRLVKFDEQGKSVTADVTPVYHERWNDTRAIRRRSRLCHERFWLIEDLAVFGAERDVTARWFLRPEQIPADRGVMIENAEGVRLHLLPLLGADGVTSKIIEGYPERIDGRSLQADFTQRGRDCRWLWLAWPEQTRVEKQDVSDGWSATADREENFDEATGRTRCQLSSTKLPLTMPAFMAATVPVARRWWYQRDITAPGGRWWLRLPRLMWDAQLWVGGKQIDLSPHRLRMELMEFDVELPLADAGSRVEVLLRVDCGASQYGKGDHQGSGFWGRPRVLVEAWAAGVEKAVYADGIVTVVSGGKEWRVEHTLMNLE